MTQIKPNRRVQKTLNKTYRLHQTDIWGALGRVSQDKRITQFVADATKSQLISELRKYPRNTARKIKQEVLWGNQKATRNLFLYQLTQTPKKRKPIKRTLQATILKMRKKLSLFYFAGRIRAKTFRKFSQLYRDRAYVSPHNKIGNNLSFSYVSYKTFTLFLEARLDVLFLRLNILPTMFAIRQALYHRKGSVKGQTPLNHPGFLVKIYREFSMDQNYTRFFESPRNIKKKNVTKMKNKVSSLTYITISHATKRFFKLVEPMLQLIRYPFTKAGLSAFKYCYRKH